MLPFSLENEVTTFPSPEKYAIAFFTSCGVAPAFTASFMASMSFVGAQQILGGVGLRVPERGIVTVLGANGVGKTTLMRTISGVYRAAAGGIVFAGEPIANLSPHR